MEIKDNEPVHIMHGNKLWERGTVIAQVEMYDEEFIIVRVNGYADRAYHRDAFYYFKNQLRVEL